MKLALFGITSIPAGRHNLKDPRLDRAHELVKAEKKVQAQVEVAEEKDIPTSDAILTSSARLSDLLTKDLDLVETRLGRGPSPAEKAVLEKLSETLLNEIPVNRAGLTPDEMATIAAHGFATSVPVIVAEEAEIAAPAELMLRAFREAGFACFLTVGGKENRAWPIRVGTTAWEAAGTIHSDLQKGFIRAEIISFADFLECGGETEAKRADKQRLEQKSYVMQDYDLTNFRFSR